MKTRRLIMVAVIAAISLTLPGCVSKHQFNKEITIRDAKIASMETEIEENETRIVSAEKRLDSHDETIGQLSETTQDALNRATEAGKIAQGKLVYEMVLSDDICTFTPGGWQPDSECALRLEDFAQMLTENHPNAYLEIQGHTDSTGDEAFNEWLGQKRADAVRQVMNERGHIALHRMTTISYGSSKPVMDNSTLTGRRANRRVVIIVLE